MKGFIDSISIKNKIIFGYLVIFFFSVGLAVVEYNRMVRIGKIIESYETVNSYIDNLVKLKNYYYEVEISLSELNNVDNNDDFLRQKNNIKKMSQNIISTFDLLERIKIPENDNNGIYKMVLDSVFRYKRVYTEDISPSIKKLIEYKKLLLNPVQIKENYQKLYEEQQKLGVISNKMTILNEDKVVSKLIDIYEYYILKQKKYIVKTIVSEQFSQEKLIVMLKDVGKKRIEDYNRLRKTMYILIYLIFIIIILFIILLNTVLANRVSKPLVDTNYVIKQISRGQIPDFEEVERYDEVGLILNSVNELIIHLKQTSKFAKEISSGNFDFEYIPSGDDDVLGNSLIELRESLLRAKKEEEVRKLEDYRRSMATDAIAKFSIILRENQNNISQLGQEVISNLVKFLNANQGVFFIVEGEGEEAYLKLVSAYAWNRVKYIEKTIQLGDGLIGSVAIEKFTVYMTDVPEDYIEIKSGTGGANPRSILIVPMKVDDEVLGVIEIASFNELEQYEIEIAERIAENTAATLKSVKISQQTAELLEKFQIQAEEMKYQEESLKQIISELRQKNEEITKNKEELNAKIKEINDLNKKIQYKDEQLQRELERLKRENKRQIEILQKNRDALLAIMSNTPFGVMIIKEGGEIVYVNKQIELLLGYSTDFIIGMNVNSLIQIPPQARAGIKVCEYLYENMENINSTGGKYFFVKSQTGEFIKLLLDLTVYEELDERRMVIFLHDTERISVQSSETKDFVNRIFEENLENRLHLQFLEDYMKEKNILVPEFKFDPSNVIRWGDKYKLGVTVIDKQHKKWFDFINKFFEALLIKKSNIEIYQLLKELKEYTEYHFSFEEKYMKEFGFEEKDKHHEVHENFIKNLESLMEKYSEGKQTSIHELILSLMEWVNNHVLVTDRRYVELFKKNGLR